MASGETRSWLIRPTDAWRQSGVWTPESAHVHGLSMEDVERDGRPVERVADELARAVAGRTVLSDAVSLDSYRPISRAATWSGWPRSGHGFELS